jgi:hypothetical protein
MVPQDKSSSKYQTRADQANAVILEDRFEEVNEKRKPKLKAMAYSTDYCTHRKLVATIANMQIFFCFLFTSDFEYINVDKKVHPSIVTKYVLSEALKLLTKRESVTFFDKYGQSHPEIFTAFLMDVQCLFNVIVKFANEPKNSKAMDENKSLPGPLIDSLVNLSNQTFSKWGTAINGNTTTPVATISGIHTYFFGKKAPAGNATSNDSSANGKDNGNKSKTNSNNNNKSNTEKDKELLERQKTQGILKLVGEAKLSSIPMTGLKLKHHSTGVLAEPCKKNIFLNVGCIHGKSCVHAHITNISQVNDKFKTALPAWVEEHSTTVTWAKGKKPNGW